MPLSEGPPDSIGNEIENKLKVAMTIQVALLNLRAYISIIYKSMCVYLNTAATLSDYLSVPETATHPHSVQVKKLRIGTMRSE